MFNSGCCYKGGGTTGRACREIKYVRMDYRAHEGGMVIGFADQKSPTEHVAMEDHRKTVLAAVLK